MILLELLIFLIAVVGVLRLLAQKWGIPHPSLVVLGGLAVALTPGLPQPTVDPELLFVIFVPPLLYWSALTISLRELRSFLGPIVRLATGLVIVTMAAVAAVVHFLVPQVGWPAAFVLGAIVSPPDPVAASAGLRGADSLVIALALPFTIRGGAPFPSRELIIFVTIGVIFLTLVVQGFSLSPLVRHLGLQADDAEAREERLVRVAMADAALDRLREIAHDEKIPTNLVTKMRAEYEQRRREAKQTHLPQRKDGFDGAAFRALRRRMQAAERAELLKLAESGKIGGDVMRHVQRQQDLRDLLLTYDEEAGSDSHEHLAPGDAFTAEREEDESESPA